MAGPKLDLALRWAWVPLAVLVLFLAWQLQNVSSETAALRNEVSRIKRETLAHRATVSPATTPAKSAPATGKSPSPPGVLSFWTDSNALGDSDYGAIIARRERRYAMGNHRYAIDQLHLSPADEQKLKQLVIAQWNARVDISDIADRTPGELAAVREKAQQAAKAEFEQQIRSLLGDETYAKFQSADQVRFEHATNWMLFTGFWDAGLPLTEDQQWGIAAALSPIHAQYRNAGAADPEDPQTGLRASDTALLAASAQILSPPQLAYLRADVLDQARYRQLVREVEAQKKAAAGGSH